MGILLCILLVFLWADSSALVNCVKMEQTAYETNRQNLVRADLANTIYEYSNGTSTRSFDAYVSSVISEAVAKMTQIGSTFIPYRRYDAIMEDQLKKLKVYELVSDIPKPVLLNAQFPLNMTPEEIFNALKGALGNTEVYEARLDNDHPIQLFLKEDSVKADTKNLDSLKADILKRLDFDDTYFLNPTPERYHKKVAEMLKYLEPLMKYDKVIEKMVMVNIESLINESVEYVEFRAFFPKQIYNLDTPRAAIKETFPQVVNRAVENYKIHSTKFVVKLIFLIDRGHKETMLEEYQRFVALLMQGQQVIGFDVFGVEKPGNSISDILKIIGTKHLAYFFPHIGENPNYSEDVYWASAAKLKRIAGGFNLPFHPIAMEKLMPTLNCIELVPLSRTIIQGVDVLSAPDRFFTVSNIEVYEKLTIGKGIGRQNLTAQYVAFLLFYPKYHIGFKALKQLVENSMKIAGRFDNSAQLKLNNQFNFINKKYSEQYEKKQ